MAADRLERRLFIWLGLTSLAGWALFTGYTLIFSRYGLHDDEGYLMMTVKNFLSGDVLYDEVYTQYGPAYYTLQWIFHSLTSLSVTHDVTRLTTLVVWTSTSMVSAFLVRRLTYSDTASVIALGVIFLGLSPTVAEPGHPQDICGFFIACVLLSATFLGRDSPPVKALVLIAILLGLLFFTKINLGIFLGLAISIGVVCFLRQAIVQRLLLTVLVLGSIALPYVLFYPYFHLGWLEFSVVSSLSLVSIVVVESRNDHSPIFKLSSAAIMGGTFFAVLATVTVFILLKGTTPAAFINGVFVQNLRFGKLFYQPAPIHPLAIYWAVLSLGTALAAWTISKRYSKFIPWLQIAFGSVTIGFTLLSFFVPNYRYVVLNFSVPFVWLIVLPRDNDKARPNFPRLILALAAVLLTFQVFPISGTQVDYANYAPILVGVIVLSDGWRRLGERTSIVFKKVALGVACVVFISAGFVSYRPYASGVPVNLPGFSLARLPRADAINLVSVTTEVRSECTALFSMPGQMSFNLWTGIDTPTKSNATAWMTLLDEQRQRDIQAVLESSARPCVIYQEKLTHDGLRDIDIRSIELARYILDNFEPRHQYGDFILLMKK
jgi:hypothetical protein